MGARTLQNGERRLRLRGWRPWHPRGRLAGASRRSRRRPLAVPWPCPGSPAQLNHSNSMQTPADKTRGWGLGGWGLVPAQTQSEGDRHACRGTPVPGTAPCHAAPPRAAPQMPARVVALVVGGFQEASDGGSAPDARAACPASAAPAAEPRAQASMPRAGEGGELHAPPHPFNPSFGLPFSFSNTRRRSGTEHEARSRDRPSPRRRRHCHRAWPSVRRCWRCWRAPPPTPSILFLRRAVALSRPGPQHGAAARQAARLRATQSNPIFQTTATHGMQCLSYQRPERDRTLLRVRHGAACATKRHHSSAAALRRRRRRPGAQISVPSAPSVRARRGGAPPGPTEPSRALTPASPGRRQPSATSGAWRKLQQRPS